MSESISSLPLAIVPELLQASPISFKQSTTQTTLKLIPISVLLSLFASPQLSSPARPKTMISASAPFETTRSSPIALNTRTPIKAIPIPIQLPVPNNKNPTNYIYHYNKIPMRAMPGKSPIIAMISALPANPSQAVTDFLAPFRQSTFQLLCTERRERNQGYITLRLRSLFHSIKNRSQYMPFLHSSHQENALIPVNACPI